MPLGPCSLCPGQRQHVDFGRFQVDRNLADRLHRVGVEQRAGVMGHLGELRDREDRPGLVVGPHDRRDRGPRPERAPIGFDIQAATRVDPDEMRLDPARDSARCSTRARIAGCSTLVVTISSRPSLAASADRMAALSDSVPPEVNTISWSNAAPSSACNCWRASFTASATCAPNACADDAFPNWSEKYGNIAATTAGSVRVVALLSR